MLRLAPAIAMILVGSTAFAADNETNLNGSSGATMGQLISEGFEIKASVPNGKRVIIFLQKDSTGYACEMVTLTRSLCGKIN